MKIMKIENLMPAKILAGLALVTVPSHAANVIVNGDFETGSLSGWTQKGSGTTVSSTSTLAGSFSAVQVPGAGAELSQTFTPFTVGATTSFVFSATDPGDVGTRSMNVAWRGSGFTIGSPQINLRLTDVDNDNDGDIQVYDGTAWQTVLTSAVVFDATPSLPSTTLTLTINSFGVGANYDLTVGAASATGLTYFQDGVLSNLAQLAFVNASNTAGTSFKFDNVSVVPEPSAALLGGLGLLALLRRRR